MRNMPILTQIGFFQNVVVNAGGKPMKVCCRKKNRLTDIPLYDASTMWGVAPPPQPREQKFTWTPPSEGRVVALVGWSASLHVTETSTWPGRGPSLIAPACWMRLPPEEHSGTIRVGGKDTPLARHSPPFATHLPSSTPRVLTQTCHRRGTCLPWKARVVNTAIVIAVTVFISKKRCFSDKQF